jgi:hypothetical protein
LGVHFFGFSMVEDGALERSIIGHTVPLAEGLPCEGKWKKSMSQVDPASRDEIEWRMELEQKQVTRLQHSKRVLASRSPEVDLVGLALGVKPKPIVVRNSDE